MPENQVETNINSSSSGLLSTYQTSGLTPVSWSALTEYRFCIQMSAVNSFALTIWSLPFPRSQSGWYRPWYRTLWWASPTSHSKTGWWTQTPSPTSRKSSNFTRWRVMAATSPQSCWPRCWNSAPRDKRQTNFSCSCSSRGWPGSSALCWGQPQSRN